MISKKYFALTFSFLFIFNCMAQVINQEQVYEQMVEHPEEFRRYGADLKEQVELAIKDYFAAGTRFEFLLKCRNEAFYGRSLELFSPSSLDQVFYAQTVIDGIIKASFLDGALRSKVALRTKSRWGNPTTIARTTESDFKVTDVIIGKHKHFLGKLFIWMREGWAEIRLNDAFQLCTSREHYLKLGAFPFELGRGISLGEAYAVSPGLLGFYSNEVIDQYAFGALAHGDIIHDKLTYDLYLAVLRNESDTFSNVTAKVFAQEIGKRENPWRGFGKINYAFASRFDWWIRNAFNSKGMLVLEPYILYNHDPEQKVNFPSDATSNLTTVGFMWDYFGSGFVEAGAEFAMNFGRQKVRPWDRNNIEIRRDPDDAHLELVYSHVLNADGSKAAVTNKNKSVVNKSPQGIAFNDKEIGDSGLFNAVNRFRAGYKNRYKGAMAVGDAAIWILKDTLKLAGTLAWASGDENPNKDRGPNDTSDNDYNGFIGLQEIYSGKRVPSLFVIGPNRIPRPLSLPENLIAQQEDPFPSVTSGFTNLIYGGFGLEWTPCLWNCSFRVRPNVLSYWQDIATKQFDIVTKSQIDALASRYLGLECNAFIDANILKNCKLYFAGGFFVPGTHFKQVKGLPLNAEQQVALDSLDKTGFVGDVPPVLGTNVAWSLNAGFEVLF